MKKRFVLFTLASVIAGMRLSAQDSPGDGNSSGRSVIVVPESTAEQSGDRGIRAHTNHLISVRPERGSSTPTGMSPASIRSAYQIPSTGGSGVIAIVDAYDYTTAAKDWAVFSAAFGLSTCTSATPASGCLTVVKVGSPRTNCGWAQEAALDIEWAHAMAPNAAIVLVEANSSSYADLFAAVDYANKNLVDSSGNHVTPNEVSMSWGGSEFSGETSYDSHFLQTGVVYFAASGDSGGKTIYPSVSPNVVAAGGTTLTYSNGAWTETAWSGSGGGPSAYEARPGYQNVIQTIVKTQRGVPDFAFDANPNTGVSVYDSTSCQGMSGWLVFGGTSVSSPCLSGIVNLAGTLNGFAQSSNSELNTIYGTYSSYFGTSSYGNYFRDITSGSAGSYSAAPGWDFVTGVGSDQGLSGK